MLISEVLKENANQFWALRYKDCELILKSCPICGKIAKLKIDNPSDGYCNYFTAHIECSNCGLRTASKTVDGYYDDEHTINDVIDLWNNRPLDKER